MSYRGRAKLRSCFLEKMKKTRESKVGAKLKPDEVVEIKKMLAEGIDIKQIAHKFWVGIGCIQGIKYGKNWKTIVI